MLKATRSSFTLIELLICIAIIAILAAILLPALAGAKRRATEVICMNNQKQLGIGIMMWAKDNKMKLPLGYHEYKRGNYFLRDSSPYLPGGGGAVFLGHLVEDEVVTEKSLFVCPFRGGAEVYEPTDTKSWVLDYSRKFSISYYSYNPIHRWWNGSSLDWKYPKMTEFSPDLPIMADWGRYRFDFANEKSHMSFATNILHLDGHVNRKQYSEYAAAANQIIATGPATDTQMDTLWDILED